MKLSSHALLEKRGAKADAMKSIMAKETLSQEDRTAFDGLDAEIRAIDADLKRVKIFEEAERFEIGELVDGQGRDIANLESRFNVGKAIAEHTDGKLTGAEAEYQQEKRSGRKEAMTVPVSALLGERRALTSTTPAGGPGSNLIQTSLGPVIDRLRPALLTESMGATVLPGLTDNLDLPRLKSSGSASWNGEHADATGSDAQFDKVSLAPKTVSALYEISRKMLLQAANLDPILRGDLGYLLAQALDAAALVGGGSNQPVGIIGNTNVSVLAMGTNGAAQTVDTAADLMGLVDDANSFGNAGFISNSKVKKAALKLKDGQQRPYGLAEVFKQVATGFSNQVPNNLVKGTGTNLSAIVYGGNWADLVIAYWSSVDIVINPYADSVAKKGGALIHAFLDADVGIRQPLSFAVAKDVIAA